MSVETLAVIFHHAPYTGRDKLILLGIANHDGDGGAWPSIATLARYANCSEASVRRTLKLLIDDGAITKQIQAGGNHNTPEHLKPNLYEITLECPPNCDKTRKHKPVDKSQGLHWTPYHLVTPLSGGDTPPLSGGDRRGVSGGDTLTVLEPTTNQLEKSPITSTSPEDQGKCFACGKVRSLRGRFCVECRSSGRDNPMLNCKEHERLGCTVVGRRAYPGQDYIVCREHR
jgi:hypothetical protein